MQFPFTVEQFYDFFREYNTTLWPAQVFLFALAVAAIVLVVVPAVGPASVFQPYSPFCGFGLLWHTT